MKFSDEEGTYEVTMHDNNGDQQVDGMTVDAQLVDGSHVSYTASGTLLEAALQNDHIDLAESDDYLSHVNSGSIENFTPASLGAADYEIQYGDTLSELAQDNHTTVAHIMELNPHLDNPNVIYAGNHIVIPTGDHASNPYEGWNPQWSQSNFDPTDVEHDNHEIGHEAFPDSNHPDMNIEEVGPGQIYDEDCGYESAPEEVFGEETNDSPYGFDGVDDTGDYENMDWQSFEDQPVDDYSGHLGNEDFDNYESPESYLEASNDLDSLSFC
jgi:LysM repeat protein